MLSTMLEKALASPSQPHKGQPLGFPKWSLSKMVLIQMVHFQEKHILKKGLFLFNKQKYGVPFF